MARIYLSAPDTSTADRDALMAAFDSGWVAPAGPDLQAFEHEVAAVCGREHGVALSTGTAALHLALLTMGVEAGDDVIVSTFTFAATVNAIAYVGARPVLIDSDEATWNMSPGLLAEELANRAEPPKAAVVVDLYGQCSDYPRLEPLLASHGVPLLSDAAEALGASCGDRPAGAFGVASAVSFNGNKMITTSGGGMFLSDDAQAAARVRHLATQAREPAAHYEHADVGYSYRLSNLLAALGRSQLTDLPRRVERRRWIFEQYKKLLGPLPGVSFMPEAPYGRANRWLTCVTIDPKESGFDREQLRLWLEQRDIESRPTWKPMHLQPVFSGCSARVDGTSERLFRTGLCLPSGSGMTDADLDYVLSSIMDFVGQRAA